MFYYLKIYRRLFIINLANLLVYRANFYNSLISSVCWGVFSIILILILTSKASSIFGWSRNELILLTGAYTLLQGIFHTFFSRNFEKFSEIVHLGQLDLILTKPADAQFLATSRYINYTSFFRILVGLVVIFYITNQTGINISLINIVGFIFLLLIGLLIFYDIWLLVMTITIWYTNLSNLSDFLYSTVAVSRYPGDLVQKTASSLFILLFPIMIAVTVPIKVLLSKALFYPDILPTLVVVTLLTLIARFFWLFALRSYTSAGG